MNHANALSAGALFDDSLPERPYPGLRPFESSEWPIFFGRERMSDEVMCRVMRDRFVVVHGDSGSGKSSLMRAGVLPRLVQAAECNDYSWVTCVASPGEDPLWNVARALGTRAGQEDAELVVAIRRALNFGRDGVKVVADLLRKAGQQHVCLLVDQFEELFGHAKRNSGTADAELLTEFLIEIQKGEARCIYAALTMRSEFIGACARFPGFAEAVNASQYLLPPMDRADLVRAICDPAPLFGGEVERALAERLILDVQGYQDQLPVIQHGLMLLHRKHVVTRGAKDKWQLRLEHYEGEGRSLPQLLSEHASSVRDSVTQKLGKSSDWRAVEDLFRALSEVNAEGHAVRRPQKLGILADVVGEPFETVRAVVDAFREDGASFLRPYGSSTIGPDESIDVSHEALIRCWQPFIASSDGWLFREFNNGLVWRALLVHADDFARDPKNVLSPTTAEDRAKWLERRTPAWAERYGGDWGRVTKLIDASLAARDRWVQEQAEAGLREAREAESEERLRSKQRWLNWLIALAVVCAGLAVVSWRNAAAANDARKRAEEASQRALVATKQAKVEQEKANMERKKAEVEANNAAREFREKTNLVNKVQGVIDAENASTSPEVQKLVALLDSEIAQVAAPVAPRVYVQISDEEQRAAAKALASRMGKLQLLPSNGAASPQRVAVPGVELVKKRPARSELRCFRKTECEQQAPKLLGLINGELQANQLKLADYSKFVATNSKLRPQHYEIWFAPGDIELR